MYNSERFMQCALEVGGQKAKPESVQQIRDTAAISSSNLSRAARDLLSGVTPRPQPGIGAVAAQQGYLSSNTLASIAALAKENQWDTLSTLAAGLRQLIQLELEKRGQSQYPFAVNWTPEGKITVNSPLGRGTVILDIVFAYDIIAGNRPINTLRSVVPGLDDPIVE